MSPRTVVLDIERVAALVEVWDLKQNGYIQPDAIVTPSRTICFAYKWLDEKKVHFASEWDLGHEGMIRKAHEVLDEADLAISYNGVSFDFKHLKTHFVEYGLAPPSPWIDVDLLKQIRKNFAFMSNRMAYVAGVLSLDGKADSHGLWKDLRSDEPGKVARARKKMARYNKRDIELTEELYYLLLPWLTGFNVGLYEEDDEIRCSNCGSDHITYQGSRATATYAYRRFQCQKCGRWGRDRKSFKSVQTVGI